MGIAEKDSTVPPTCEGEEAEEGFQPVNTNKRTKGSKRINGANKKAATNENEEVTTDKPAELSTTTRTFLRRQKNRKVPRIVLREKNYQPNQSPLSQ